MQRITPLLLGLTLAAGGLLLAAPPASAGNQGVTVYTWTDANGVTHFSDTPRHTGTTRQLSLPTPPPPDQTAIKADKAWLSKLHRMTQKDLAQAAAHRRAAQERELETAERQQQPEEPQYQYVPIFYPARRRHHHHWDHHRHRGNSQPFPSAAFPHYALPSSFPDPLASSFPPGLHSSFPESQSSPPGRP